jgi:hypothetical protein
MSVALLGQVFVEVRRLSIAGSSTSAGDFRLKKLIPALEQAGQKGAVFGRVAQMVSLVVESNEATAPEAILDLSTLLNAILYTQGETGVAGVLQPISTVPLPSLATQTPARTLKPVMEALTTKGSGRLEVVRDAQAAGVFQDLRLVKPALAALDDGYSEVADFVAEHVIPFYGTAIVPLLCDQFDHSGRSGDARRLKLIHGLDRASATKLVQKSLVDGSKEVRIAAIECLGDRPETVSLLQEQMSSRSQEVRQAALTALGRMNTDAAVAEIERAIHGDDLRLVVGTVQTSSSVRMIKCVVDAARQQFQELIKAKDRDKAEVTALCVRMMLLLTCLEGHQEEIVDRLLLELFTKRNELDAVKGDLGGKDIVERLAALMSVGPQRSASALIEAHATLHEEGLACAFFAAIRTRPADQVYQLFSPYYLFDSRGKRSQANDVAKQKKVALATSMSQTFMMVTPSRTGLHTRNHAMEGAELRERLDRRWLAAAMAQKDLPVVFNLAVTGHAGLNELLRETFDAVRKRKSSSTDLLEVIHVMIRVEHPFAIDAIAWMIQECAKSPQLVYWCENLISQLPKAAAPQIEALLSGLPDKVVDRLMESIATLKNKP